MMIWVDKMGRSYVNPIIQSHFLEKMLSHSHIPTLKKNQTGPNPNTFD